MSSLLLHPFFHVGIVVSDLAAAQDELTRQIGVTWGPVLHLDETEVRDGDGQDLVLPSTICYSVEEPRLELIQEVPGSVWQCNEHSNLHHLGFWSDDLSRGSEGLVGAGCPLQLSGRVGESAPEQFAYHQGDLKVRLEVLDAAMQPMLGFLFEPPT
jgi:hypothetical protein